MAKIQEKGIATSSRCPRRGVAYVRPNAGVIYSMPTNCKSWSCKACRDRKIGLVVSLMTYGCYRLTKPWLVSLTFKVTVKEKGRAESLVSATYAEAAFKEFIRRMRLIPWFEGIEWIRVVEPTKKKQIHFHLLMGKPTYRNLGGNPRTRCQRHPKWSVWRKGNCQCVMHQFSRVWEDVTKGSYIVDVRDIWHIDGAAYYVAKYLKKSMYGEGRDILVEKGYSRRYMASRGWPRGAQMKRYGTLMKQWVSNSFRYGEGDPKHQEWSEKQPLMRQVGTNMAKEMIQNMTARRIIGAYEKVYR